MGTKQNIDTSAIRGFLRAPEDREAFEAFFKLANRLVANYLRYLQDRIQQIQIQYSNPNSIIHDVSMDVLGEFFQSKEGKPFFVIFDYFKRHQIDDFNNISDGVLSDHFRNLLFGYCRKKIGHLRAEGDPQIANLKRRFKEIISQEPYAVIKIPGHPSEIVCQESNVDKFKSDIKLPEFARILEIVRKAFAESRTRTQLIAKVFQVLEQYDEYSGCLRKNDLLIALIEINASYIDDTYSDIPEKYGFQISRVRELGRKYMEVVLNEIKEEYIEKYIQKGRLCPKSGEWIQNAVRAFLTDFLESQPAFVPTYFREHFPEKYHECYATDYKYIFDTVLSRGKELLIENIRNSL